MKAVADTLAVARSNLRRLRSPGGRFFETTWR